MIVLGAAPAVVRDAHEVWAWVVIVLNAVAGAWALMAHRHERFRRKELWRFTAVAEVAIFIQVILGVILVQGRKDVQDALGFHLLYGFSAAFAVAVLYSYRNQLSDKKYLLYGFGGLFISGLCLVPIPPLP